MKAETWRVGQQPESTLGSIPTHQPLFFLPPPKFLPKRFCGNDLRQTTSKACHRCLSGNAAFRRASRHCPSIRRPGFLLIFRNGITSHNLFIIDDFCMLLFRSGRNLLTCAYAGIKRPYSYHFMTGAGHRRKRPYAKDRFAFQQPHTSKEAGSYFFPSKSFKQR